MTCAAGDGPVAHCSQATQAGRELVDWLIPLLLGSHQRRDVDMVALPHHGKPLDLLEQVHHGVNSVPQCSLYGLLKSPVMAVQQPVPELHVIRFIGCSDILVQQSYEVFEVLLAASPTDQWSIKICSKAASSNIHIVPRHVGLGILLLHVGLRSSPGRRGL